MPFLCTWLLILYGPKICWDVSKKACTWTFGNTPSGPLWLSWLVGLPFCFPSDTFSKIIFLVGLAVAVPYIDLFISLVGAFCISFSGIAFPAIMDSCVQHPVLRGNRKVLVHAKNIAITIFALVGLVVGTATSLEKIIEKFGPIESVSVNGTSTW